MLCAMIFTRGASSDEGHRELGGARQISGARPDVRGFKLCAGLNLLLLSPLQHLRSSSTVG